MSETEKPKLGMRAPLGIKRTVETGQVKQSFSHGRQNTVVVEVKRRRFLGKPGEAEAAPVIEAKVEAAAPPPPPPAPAPAPKAPAGPQLSRQEIQTQLLREAEEARMAALQGARRREDQAKQATTGEEKRRAEENRKSEEAAVETARLAIEEEARQAALAAEREANAPAPTEAAPAAAEEDDRPRRHGSAVPPRREPERPSRGRGGDDRRQSGKLTVSRALDDGEGARARSLAALKRAREKEKRSHMQGGPSAKQFRDVSVPESITVQELAIRMAERGADLVKALFKMGMPVTLTQTIDQDTAELLVTEFGHNITRVSDADIDIAHDEDVDATETLQSRPPVVAIMGHVDHGKTSLLDALRGTDVVAGEAGGITQHIGAYQLTMKDQSKITFLDTPGHEAFTEMRARGANVTDVVVIVVAADDGPKPQTVEAINHVKAAGVPMIIAITKIDKHEADAQKVREQLLQYEVIVESLSGDVQEVEVSAKAKTGLDALIEKIQLQAELSDLRANPDRSAEGKVIEAKLDKGRGPVATVLVQRGTLKIGDIFVVGAESGRVRAMVNDKGQQITEAGPSLPVEVLGLSGVPSAGDTLSVVDSEARAREVATYRAGEATKKRTGTGPASLESMFSALKEKQVQEYPLVIKGDVQGTVEAIVGSLAKIPNQDIRARVLHDTSGAGTTGIDDQYAEEYFAEIGAEIMGAGMFGFHMFPDDPDWMGWWGDEPPFHCPVFVLTHHTRPPMEFAN